MAEMEQIFIFITLLLLFSIDVRHHRKLRMLAKESSEARDATEKICDIDQEIIEWEIENPDANWSHPKAQALLRRKIRAEHRFKDTHPFDVDAESRIARYSKHLNS